MRARPRSNNGPSGANLPPLLVEITAVFKLDCMVAGIVPHPMLVPPSAIMVDGLPTSLKPEGGKQNQPQTLTSFLIVAYTPPETFEDTDLMTEDRTRQARKAAERPEIRIISRAGEEVSADALSIAEYERWGCNEYTVVEAVDLDDPHTSYAERSYVVMSPRNLVKVKPRDKRDHVEWLVGRGKYEEALTAAETIEAEEKMMGVRPPPASADDNGKSKDHLSSQEIGQKYLEHLFKEGYSLQIVQWVCFWLTVIHRSLYQGCKNLPEGLRPRFEAMGELDICVRAAETASGEEAECHLCQRLTLYYVGNYPVCAYREPQTRTSRL